MLEKVAIEHVTPPNGPSVALTSTLLHVLFLTPGAIFGQQTTDKTSAGGTRSERSDQRQSYWRTLITAALLAGIASLLEFSAIAIGPVWYVTASSSSALC